MKKKPYEIDRALPDVLPDSPFPLFQAWFDEAAALAAQPNPNAVTIATVAQGRPSARVVLCRGIETDPGFIVFFTNRRSRKGHEITHHGARAAAVFHWDHLDLQVRIEGPVVESPEAESDNYFSRRRYASQLASWASDQSKPVASREALVERFKSVCARFGVDPDTLEPRVAVPRPPHWGGYRLWAESMELWAGSPVRFHDRARWTRTLTPEAPEAPAPGPWSATRLQP